jgi:acetolactate decarboxylase
MIMKKYILLLFAVIISACSTVDQKTLTQISTIDALLAGCYDGTVTVSKILEYGNFGIGTFDKLDGEMIVLDGVVYQFKADGKLYKAPENISTPFASVVKFNGGVKHKIKNGNLKSIEAAIDSLAGNLNLPYAVYVSGKFLYTKTRSVPAQSKPYKSLAEITKTQPIFELTNVDGSLVGFRLPPFMKGINVPGYHLHLISDDRLSGGHLLDCTFDTISIEVMPVHEFKMILPENSDFGKIDLSKDRTEELNKVEK